MRLVLVASNRIIQTVLNLFKYVLKTESRYNQVDQRYRQGGNAFIQARPVPKKRFRIPLMCALRQQRGYWKHYVEKKIHKKCVYQGYDSPRENTSELLQLFMISGAVLVY